MFRLELTGALCISCGLCRDVCTRNAIGMRTSARQGVERHSGVCARPKYETFPFLATPEECDGCLECVRECPVSAIAIRARRSLALARMTSTEIVNNPG